MGFALVVPPRQAGELYHVAPTKAAMTEERVLLPVGGERWQAVLMVGKWAASDPLVTDAPEASGTTKPVCQVDYRHGLFGGVDRADVGEAAISGRASRLGLM
jgi:hypothetical protein